MTRKRTSKKATDTNTANTLVRPALPEGRSKEADVASMVVDGIGHNTVVARQFSASTFGETDLTECQVALDQAVAAVHAGDLRNPEGLLTAQAVALNAIFTNLARRAHDNMGVYLETTERYMRLALKAQGQCRATVETIAAIKNPPVVFARQANIAHGPLQVNNRAIQALPGPSRAGNLELVPNELLEAHGERVDGGTAGLAVGGDSALATLGAFDRPENG